MRPHFHFAPARGWMNDPNGLIDHNGLHHLFFQYNPHANIPEKIHWGHATSTDFIVWQEHSPALAPGSATDPDADGCWSGCTLVAPDGSVLAIYSGHRDGIQLPCAAVAADACLETWQKSPRNPIIASRPDIPGLTDLRDHTIVPTADGYRQALAGGGQRGGFVYTYTSSDLDEWQEEGVLLAVSDLGLDDDIWECPDLYEDACTMVLILSVITLARGDLPERLSTMWVTGVMDGKVLVPRHYGILDRGQLFYAPQSYWTADRRRVSFGWLRMQEDRAAHGQENLGAMSVPRTLRVVDGRVCQSPAEELLALRHDRVDLVMPPDMQRLDVQQGSGALELVITAASTDDLLAVSLVLKDRTTAATIEISLEMFAANARWTREDGKWLAEPSNPREARILVDTGIVEVFLDDGQAAALSDVSVHTASVLHVRRARSAAALSLSLWRLDSAAVSHLATQNGS